MRILVVNPNSTGSMTETIARAARSVAAPGTIIEAVSPDQAPASIEGYNDESAAVPPMIEELRKAEQRGCDGYVIACFDDPGLGAAREVVSGPVVGICEAAVHAAAMLASRFSVVTSLDRSIPIIEDLVAAYGAERRCRRVRAINMPVLEIERDGLAARARIAIEIKLAITEDRSDAIVLGCAGMSQHCGWLAQEMGMPVIDGVIAAVKFTEALIGAGYRTSKAGAYAPPLPKGRRTGLAAAPPMLS